MKTGVVHLLTTDEAEKVKTAIEKAVDLCTQIIYDCEEDVRRGQSPNPHEKSSPNEVMANCYAGTHIVGELREAAKILEEE